MSDRLTMQDPRHQYPRPPFPHQPQPVPGLAADLDPIQAYEPSAILLDYATTKAGIVAYAKALAKQLLASQEASFINGEVYGVTGGVGVA